MKRFFVVVAVIALSTTGCGTTEPPEPAPAVTTASAEPSPVPQTTAPQPLPTQTGVVSGAYCSNEGQPGITKRGVKMTCKTTLADPRLRWRRS